MNPSELSERMVRLYDTEAEHDEAAIGHGLGKAAEQEA